LLWTRRSDGKEPILVFIHGWGMNATAMYPFQETASKLGFATINFDLPGHGHSKDEKGSFKEAIKSIKELVGDKKCILFAYSLGGFIAQQYASKYPVDGLFLISTAFLNPILAFSKDPIKMYKILSSVFLLSSEKSKYTYFSKFVKDVIIQNKNPKPKILDKSRCDFLNLKHVNELLFFYECLSRTSLDIMADYFKDMCKFKYKKLKNNGASLVISGSDDAYISNFSGRLLALKLSGKHILLPRTNHLSIIHKKNKIQKIFKKWLIANYIKPE
jgi:pimeloyl-ACP methyl ester carboxylesterase